MGTCQACGSKCSTVLANQEANGGNPWPYCDGCTLHPLANWQRKTPHIDGESEAAAFGRHVLQKMRRSTVTDLEFRDYAREQGLSAPSEPGAKRGADRR